MRSAALIFALSAAVSWGLGGVLLKQGLSHVSPTTFLVFQYALGAIAIGAWVLATGGAGAAFESVERRWPSLILIVVLQVGGYIGFVGAISRAGPGSIPTAAVIAIAASYPALVAILSGPFLGERLGWNDAVGVGLIVAGVAATQLR
ncbi:MAG: EamA family transporter [Gaiellales bacterium]